MTEKLTEHSALSVEGMILTVRGQKVILDSALARLYGVETKRLNEQVRRNTNRFPSDFMFQLTTQEVRGLRSQSATSKTTATGRNLRPVLVTWLTSLHVKNLRT